MRPHSLPVNCFFLSIRIHIHTYKQKYINTHIPRHIQHTYTHRCNLHIHTWAHTHAHLFNAPPLKQVKV